MTALPANLPDVSRARLPATYEAAKSALSECSRIDECAEWANKAEALASYAKQANDDQMRKMADRIQARAIRRCGELLKQVPQNSGGRPPELAAKQQTQIDSVLEKLAAGELTRDQANKRIAAIDPQWAMRSRTNAAISAGMSQDQKRQALRIASVPAEDFEATVEGDDPPTVTALAEQGKKTRTLIDLGDRDPAEFSLSTQGQGHLRRFAEFAAQTDPIVIARGALPHEHAAIRRHIATIDGWLDRLIVSLEK